MHFRDHFFAFWGMGFIGFLQQAPCPRPRGVEVNFQVTGLESGSWGVGFGVRV